MFFLVQPQKVVHTVFNLFFNIKNVLWRVKSVLFVLFFKSVNIIMLNILINTFSPLVFFLLLLLCEISFL